MSRSRDYYQALGIGRSATDAEIKRAYRRLARQLHPDVTGDDARSTERFKEITEAYEVLSDPRRRRHYDMFGTPAANGPAPGPDPFAGFADAFADVLRRSQRRQAGPEPGVDVERNITVTLAEAATGTEKTMTLDVLRACAGCGGNGWPHDNPPEACPECRGTGTRGGTFPLKRTCPRCDGNGTVRRYACKRCAGEGHRREEETLTVTVPAGVSQGTKLRLKGRGDVGVRGGPQGDLYVVVDVATDPRFERAGADLKTTLRVGLREVLLGGHAEVPLPDGTAVMTIPSGTQGGQVFRLRGRGMPRLGSDKSGDLFVTVQVRIPKDLPPQLRVTMTELFDTLDGHSRSNTGA